MGKRCPTALAGHSATLTPQRATYATSALFLGIHREFIACCYLRFTGVGSFLYRCLVEEQASGPLLFRINPRAAVLCEFSAYQARRGVRSWVGGAGYRGLL